MMAYEAQGARRASRGRWIWIATAVATAVVFIAATATFAHVREGLLAGAGGPWLSTSIQTVTFPQQVSAVDVHDYGASVQVSAARTGGAQVTEVIRYNGTLPPVERSVANHQLTLADPACSGKGPCSVAFRVTVPAGTTARVVSDGGAVDVSGLTAPVAADSGGGPVTVRSVTGRLEAQSGGGPVTVTGGAGPVAAESGGGAITVTGPAGPVTADSGGGPVTAQSISGGLSAQTSGGALTVHDESGTLSADTGGGPADATGVAANDVTVSTAGGAAEVALTDVPRHVQADSGGGPVTVQLPGGSYAVSANSGGGPQQIGVATNPASPDTISVTSGGGAVDIQ